MGRTKTPKYRIELSCIHFGNKRREVHSFAFKGRPTTEAAKKFRDDMNKSMAPGGTNEHIAKIQSPYGTATIYNQFTQQVAAIFTPPIFEVIN